MAIKLIGLDLDGTLLSPDRRISERTLQTLAEAAERGVHIVPVTGRPLCGIPDFVRNMQGTDYIISSNGASLWHEGQCVMSHTIPAELCIELLHCFESSYEVAEVFIDGVGYEDEFSFSSIKRKHGGTPVMIYFESSRKVVRDIYSLLQSGSAVEEVAVMFYSEEICSEMLELLKRFPMLKAVRPMPNYLEIMAADGGKGTMLLELAEKLGITRDEIMAVGDSDNDSDMLAKVGFPVAMGNADKKLKQLARFVSDDYRNDGVAVAVEKFVLGTEPKRAKPAVIFLDVDGTIIDVEGNVPPSAAKAIAQAQALGNICVINTGRPFSHVVDSVKALGIQGYICACGQYIALDGKILKNRSFTPEDSRLIIQKARECRVDLFIESENGLFHSFVHPISERMNEEFDRFRRRGFDVDASVDAEGFSFSKVCAWERSDSCMAEFLEFSSAYLYPIRHEGAMYEMVQNGCSKAAGIKEFIEYCGLEGYTSYAVGDSGNDEEMLRSVEHSIAMGNAPDGLKAITEYVTADLTEDGLAKAFLHYGLI